MGTKPCTLVNYEVVLPTFSDFGELIGVGDTVGSDVGALAVSVSASVGTAVTVG